MTSGSAAAGATAQTSVAYRWPTGDPATVLRGFDRPEVPWGSGHRGADLELAAGSPVLAAGDGVVAFAGRVVDRGVVSIDHDDGVRTTYEPLTPAVRRGERVSGGTIIGTLDVPSHCEPGSCLHWGARRGAADYIDPMSLLSGDVVIRLLPQHDG